jgi:hypothetical protein
MTPEEFLDRFIAMLQVQPAVPERTHAFLETKHEELCLALLSWFNQLLLLFGDVVQVAITQGLHDEGVDLLVEQLSTHKRIGLQVKSYFDISEKDFHQKVLSQITASKKHDLMRLFVILCADLTDPTQLNRSRGLVSELSQMDNYAVPIVAERAVIILNAFRKKEHPLSLIKGEREIATVIQGLSRALSSDQYDATVSVTLQAHETKDFENFGTIEISFVPGESAIKSMEMLRIAEAGLPVTIPGESIEKLVLLDKDGKPLVPSHAKIDNLRIIPNVAKLPFVKLVVRDPETNSSIQIEHVQFVREDFDGLHLQLVSDESSKPFRWKLDLDFEKKTAHITYHFDAEGASVKAGLRYARFITALNKSRQLEIRRESDNSLMGQFSVSDSRIEEGLAILLELLEALSIIEEKTGVEFTVPTSATQWDLDMAKNIRQLLVVGSVELHEYSFQMLLTRSSDRAIEMLREKGILSDIVIKVNDLEANLFNRRLSLGPATYQIPSARPLTNLADLEGQFKRIEKNQPMTFDMVSCGEYHPLLRLERK